MVVVSHLSLFLGDNVIPHFIYIQMMLYSAELKRGTA